MESDAIVRSAHRFDLVLFSRHTNRTRGTTRGFRVPYGRLQDTLADKALPRWLLALAKPYDHMWIETYLQAMGRSAFSA
jgi:hypothetical protein